MWSRSAGAAAGSKCGVFFLEEPGAWGGGEDAFERMFVCGEPRRGERSEREGRPAAALRPWQASLFLLAVADPPVCRRDLVDLVELRGPAPVPGIRTGVVFGKTGCRVMGQALDNERGFASSAGGVVCGFCLDMGRRTTNFIGGVWFLRWHLVNGRLCPLSTLTSRAG